MLAPFDPYKESVLLRLKPFGYRGHWLGTDELGRDILTRLLYGGQTSLLMGVVPVVVAGLIGGTLGVVAGYASGWVGTLIMRTMDVFYAFPSVLLAVAISGAMGGGMLNGMIALALVFIPAVCRVAETATTQVRNLDFVEAARATGAGHLMIVRYHLLGNVLAPVLVYASSLVSVVDPAGVRAVVPGPGRAAADAGLGADAEHLAAGDLRAALGLRDPRRGDLPDQHVLQPGQRRAALGDGRADLK